MSTIVKTDKGYVLEENGVQLPIVLVTEGKTMQLPANASNRKYYDVARFEKTQVGGRLDLTYKPTVHIEKTGDTQPRNVKPLEDWLEGDDRELYLMLKAKAQKTRDEANTKAPATPLEKAKKAYEKAQKALEDLLAKEGGAQ